MKRRFLITTAIAVFAGSQVQAKAQSLGTAQSFAVLGGSTVTNTGSSVVSGNLGVSPGSAITGFPPGTVVPPSTLHAADAVAGQAQSDLTIAYNSLAGMACNTDLTGQDLGGLTLTAGVYCFSSSAQLTGVLTLDAQGVGDALFVFQIGSTITTASNSSVLLTNGGQACNVFWQVGSSATLGTDTAFVGNILALTSITLNTGADVSGRALARNGAVTMDTNHVSINSCAPCASDTDCAPGLVCDVNVEVCVCTPNVPCDDHNACTADTCDPATGCVFTDDSARCDDGDLCTKDRCDPVDGCVNTPCDDDNACTTDLCNPVTGCVFIDNSVRCDDADACTADRCDPVDGCVHTPIAPCCGDGQVDGNEECDGADDAACPGSCRSDCTCPSGAIGCRITGGRQTLDGRVDPGPYDEITRGTGGGQVGAPCGCIGCFTTPDPNDDLAFQHIQGNWQYSRKSKQGTFHAKEYNSLICGCDANSPVCDSTGVAGSGLKNSANFTGDLCNPGNPIPGPEPRKAPANVACFSGMGGWTPTNGRKETQVAFRVEVEDRGEPAVGRNADATCDVMRIRIWIPTARENVKLLADGACCTNSVPVRLAARPPDIDDGGNLVHGNIQIHPVLPNTQDGTCPVPNGNCQQP